MADPRVTAIRNNELVGNGTCSTFEECYSDQELIERLNDENISTPEKAVEWAIFVEGLQMEKALNQRFGDDDDPQVSMYNEWHEKLKQHKENQ